MDMYENRDEDRFPGIRLVDYIVIDSVSQTESMNRQE